MMLYMPDEWTEINLVPHSLADRFKVLLEVVDPLVHDKLSGRIDSWHYGLYGMPAPFHLRLRLHWREPGQAAEGKTIASAFLDLKQNEGVLQDSYEGSHGERGKTYSGEYSKFREMWDVTYRFWEGQSEFSLELLGHESDGSLSDDLSWHWETEVHLFSNRLGLTQPDEIYLGLQRALAYIDQQSPAAGQLRSMQRSIGTQGMLTESVYQRFKKDFGIP
jgi:lantibiotic biosynthesis dehydratase-like protein